VSLSKFLSVSVSMSMAIVPERRVRNIPEVILVRRWVSWGSGNLEGEGWVRVGRGVGQGGSVYKQPETEVDDSCHS
jgi:hypothetical protein